MGRVCYREAMRIAVGVVLALAAVVSPAAAQRLPGGVTPEHYTLWVAPDIASATFRGTVDIRVRLDAPTAAITMHAAEITFDAVTIEAGGKTVYAVGAEDSGLRQFSWKAAAWGATDVASLIATLKAPE